MGKGKLYGSASSFRTQKALIAAKLANVDVELAGEQAPANNFPLGVTPAYEDGDVRLFGGDAIALYFISKLAPNKQGGSCGEQLQWLEWAEGRLLPNVLGYVLPSVSAAQLEKSTVDAYRAELLEQLKRLNTVLLSRTWLAGERFGIADISVALDLVLAYRYVIDENVRKGLQNVNRWLSTVLNQPAVHAVLGDVQFATKPSSFDAATFAEYQKKAQPQRLEGVSSSQSEVTEKVNDEKGDSKRKAKNAAKKKEKQEQPAKKQEKKKKDDDDADEADEALASEPKANDPFATMAPSKFNYDAFKRAYSNEDTDKVALPFFWENFDAENNSIWYCEYKFPTELTQTFMSCNLISGMFQRLEKLKKGAFASVCLFGTNNNSTISGVWVWRGQDLIFPLSPDWTVDYESYNWKKLDPASPETKTLVAEYFKWEGGFGGKTFNQGKIFK